MRYLLQSSFVMLSMGLLLVLTVVNTCQINNLEQAVIDSRLELREMQRGEGGGIALRGGLGSEARAGVAGSPRRDWRPSVGEEAALSDPANLLSRPTRGFVRAATVRRGGTLRQIGQDPRGLNPYIANGADMTAYNAYVNDALARRRVDDPDRWQPSLALKVTTPDDGLTYEVTLRKGVKWHRPAVDWQSGRYEWLRGEHLLQSDDYAFVFDMFKNPQVAGRISSLRNYFEAFEGYEVIDRHRFVVRFRQRLYTNLPALLALLPMPRWLYRYDEDGRPFDDATWGLKLNEHWYNQRAIGTGRYRFVSWMPGVKIELQRFADYWGEQPAFDRVVMPVVKDQNAWPRKLKAGEIDLTQLQPEQYRTEVLGARGPILGQKGLRTNTQPTLGYFYLGWNADRPLFADTRVRQALTMALDRASIVRSVFHGLGAVTSGPFAQQSPCYDADIEPWPYDLRAAGRKLGEAGWTDTDGDGIRDRLIDGVRRPFDFTLLIYGSSTEWQTVANIYREALLQVGVRMTPRAVEWSTMLKKMDERDFDVFTGAWVLDWDIDLHQLWHSEEADRPKGSNRVGFRSAEGDRIAVALRREFDPQRRVELCHAFHALVHEEQPYTFIYQRTRPVAYWSHLNEPEYSLVWPHRDLRFWSFNEERP